MAAIVLACLAGAAHAAPATGSWQLRGPAQSGMWLMTLQDGESVRFQLEIARGAPSYNSGWIEGSFALAGGKGVFRSSDGACEIAFAFAAASVRVHEVPGKHDCGFGFNVRADGTLLRTSGKAPRFAAGDPRTGGTQ
jgi:hypothetical protein